MRWEIRVIGEPKAQPRSNTRTRLPSFSALAGTWSKCGGSLKVFYGKLHGLVGSQVYVPEAHPVNEWKRRIDRAVRSIGSTAPIKRDVMFSVELVFLFPRPKYMDRGAKYPAGRLFYSSRQGNDLDNLEKPPLDVITKAGWWPDDGLVVKLRSEKYYAGRNEQPGCELVIETVTDAVVPGQKSLFELAEDSGEDDF